MSSGRDTRLLQLTLLGEAAQRGEGVAIFVWDDDRNYVAVNDAACDLVGLTCDELLTMKVGALTPNRAEPHFDNAQREPTLTGRSRIDRRDGTSVDVEWISFHTHVAALPYMVSVVWPVPSTD
jgi:PAS domain S-box-containing protein